MFVLVVLFFVFLVFTKVFSSTENKSEDNSFEWKWDAKINTWARCGPDGEIDEL